MTTVIMNKDVRYTTATQATALTLSIVTTHPQTDSWVYTLIAVMGVVIGATTVAVIAATTVLLLLRRWRQTQNNPNHYGKGWKINTIYGY